MSNSKKHKEKGKFNNKILTAEEVCDSTRAMWDRHNFDFGEHRKAKKDLEDRIAEKGLKEEIRIIETGENIDFDIPEQEKY